MIDNSEISKLYIKSIFGELEDEEHERLNNFMSNHKVNKNIKDISDRGSFDSLITDYNYFKDRQSEIKRDIKRKFIRNKVLSLSKYAAIFLLPLIVFWGIVVLDDSYESRIVLNDKKNIELNFPVLRLEDGSSIILNNDKLAQNKLGSNISLNNELREIRYYKKQGVGVDSQSFSTLEIPACCEYKVFLSDGTKVLLNAMSKLRYPNKFNGKYRVVELEGEGYFEVAKNKQKPFIVKTANQRVRVLGTKFNINSYENNVYTTLIEGRVSVRNTNKDNLCRILTPGKQSIVSNKKIVTKEVDVDDVIAWINGEFIFRKQRLDDVLVYLARWYDFKVFYLNYELKDRLVSLKVKKFERPEHLFVLMEKAYGIRFKLNGKSLNVMNK